MFYLSDSLMTPNDDTLLFSFPNLWLLLILVGVFKAFLLQPKGSLDYTFYDFISPSGVLSKVVLLC